MKQKVLIVVGIPNFDYSNEKSAVASFLSEIKLAFEIQGAEVHFPKFQKTNVAHSENSSKKGMVNRVKQLIKQWPWLYFSIVNRSYFKKQDKLIEAFTTEDAFTQIIEFHTVGSTLGVQLARKYKVKLSVIFDSPVDEQFLEMYGTKTFYWNRIKESEKLSLEGADRIMAYSDGCGEFIKNKYTINAGLNILPCVINKKAVENEPTTHFKIGFIGSFLTWHKVDLLVRAFNVFINQTKSDAQLLLIGYGEEWERVQSLVKKLDLTKRVEMPGFVSEEELNNYKKNMSVAVMPGTNWYGSPLKLFEYAQCGIPFIAPESITVKSIFKNKEHCLYVDANDEEKSLVEQLLYLYNNEIERVTMGHRVKNHFELNYSKDVYAKQLYQFLK